MPPTPSRGLRGRGRQGPGPARAGRQGPRAGAPGRGPGAAGATKPRGAKSGGGQGARQWLWPDAKGLPVKLRELELRPKKGLGQNFLTDEGVLRRIAETALAGVAPGEPVVEVGPGPGNLTKHLLAAGAAITAVEKDTAFAEKLGANFGGRDDLAVVNEDVLRWLRRREYPPGRRLRLVANLPFNITTDLLKLILPLGEDFSQVTLLLQDEAAQRLLHAQPGDSNYRAMSLKVHFFAEVAYEFKISNQAFFPRPKCDCCLVTFRLRPRDALPAAPSPEFFQRVVNNSFLRRRKMLKNNLRPAYSPPEVEAALGRAGLAADIRAQELSVDDYARFCRALQEIRAEDEAGLMGALAAAEAEGEEAAAAPGGSEEEEAEEA